MADLSLKPDIFLPKLLSACYKNLLLCHYFVLAFLFPSKSPPKTAYHFSSFRIVSFHSESFHNLSRLSPHFALDSFSFVCIDFPSSFSLRSLLPSYLLAQTAPQQARCVDFPTRLVLLFDRDAPLFIFDIYFPNFMPNSYPISMIFSSKNSSWSALSNAIKFSSKSYVSIELC